MRIRWICVTLIDPIVARKDSSCIQATLVPTNRRSEMLADVPSVRDASFTQRPNTYQAEEKGLRLRRNLWSSTRGHTREYTYKGI